MDLEEGGEYEMASLDATDSASVPLGGPAHGPRPARRVRHRRRACACLVAHACCMCWTTIVLVLPLLAAAAVFLPWFLVDIQPRIALEESMRETTCLITNHTIIDTKPVDGNMRLVYMPGLVVTLSVAPHKAVATARAERSASWMSAEVTADYFARHPVNTTTACYTDGERVALRPGVDGIGNSLASCIAITASTFFGTLALCLVVTALPWRACIRALMAD
ncbi:hypothetical protein psal_cds_1237 [Pandoravirus salinus]|uniref:Uncharacterized protein n=1 Tax=Pandoravirus salinus TaxID=1349410 RepID=S4W196_9VIRU|nr:hypothetical protein psal_cds_1237 [Pandoravirus salinus]AGO85561.2 hypothetical protein psal_cds_1237 [Pandoravirus salinus]